MKETIFQTRNSRTQVVRDNHDESGQYYFHQVVYDDPILERNKRLRLEGLMSKGQSLPAVGHGDNAEAVFAFSIPAEHFARLYRDHPDIMLGLKSPDVNENHKAAQKLKQLHPEWSVMEGNR